MRRLLIIILTLTALCATGGPAAARVYIDITRPFSRQLPLAMPSFDPMPGAAADEIGKQGKETLERYLSYTGLFDFLDPASFLGRPEYGDKVEYGRWKKVGAELLITGFYRHEGGTLTVEMRLYDTNEGRLLVGRRYDGATKDLGAMMARFADEVIMAISGERSVFSTMIAFVGASQGAKGVVKDVYLMRFDGTGVVNLSNRGDISLYPAWKQDGSLLGYTSYRDRRPCIYVHALAGGTGKAIITKPGVNLTPAFRPGHEELAAALSFEGKTNIYLAGLTGQILKHLTNGWGIEVAPSFSPDGRQMAYVSDRGGNPQIYILDLASGQNRRLTFGFKYCAAPDWSPKGDSIAFQAEVDGTFQVATVRPDGSGLKVLTSGWGGGEDPSWSPDGRLIAYTSRATGVYQIYVMTREGQSIARLTSFKGGATDPAWSPRGIMLK